MLKRFIALTLFLVFLQAPACRADEITTAMRQADPRLQTRITLRSPRILVGELLERLSRQSGVTLAADDWSAAGSDSVAVSLRDIPLSEAMNALWSVFSYKHAEWDWRRTSVKGTDGKYTYTLRRPDYARFQAERLKEQVQTDFEAQAQRLFAALDMPPEQLKEAAKHDFLMKNLLLDGRVGPEARLLASLPPETLLNIIRNHQPFSMPVSELSPEIQKALQEARNWEVATVVKQGYPASSVLPDAPTISIVVDSSPNLAAPGLMIDTGRGGGDCFGGSYMEAEWRQRMNGEWIQPGEAADNPASARALPALKQPVVAGQTHALADYLLRFADAAHIPLIARIPRGLDKTSGDAVSQISSTKTIGAFLQQAAGENPNLQHKWRGGVLLLTCQNWFMSESEESRLPWAAVKRLRDAEAAGDGFLSLSEFAHAAGVMTEAQMKALGEWFPVMNNAAPWHDFLAFYDKTPEYRPRVLSKAGDASQYPESLVNALLGIDALRAMHPNLRLQIHQPPGTENKPPTRQIAFIVRDDDGVKLLGGQGFEYVAHEYQSSLKVEEGAASGSGKASASKQP